MKEDKLRIGQRDALATVRTRLSIGESYTAIVLPTRYGKSDVIRVATVDLVQRGIISCALVMSPSDFLREQIGSKERFQQTLNRYGMSGKGIKIRALQAPHPNPTANGEIFLSTTMQLVNRNVDIFTDWVESMLHRYGMPVAVFVDECHTGSEDNSWGDTVRQLVKKGAKAILLTATALRSDGRTIPGFAVDILDEEAATIYKRSPGSSEDTIRVDVYEGLKQIIRLKAHHETTFKQAWRESPSPLCQISRIPFDVELAELEDFDALECKKLSELPETETRRILGRIVRDRSVIRAGCERLIEHLKAMRHLIPAAAAIIFSGNDDDPEKRVNEHAKAIRQTLEELWPGIQVSIATVAEDGDQGAKKIRQFCDGAGDVLIVKQMASLGLDAPRLKIELDLSSMRTPAAYIQRLMRIATPYGPSKVGVYIAPDDCLSKRLFDSLIAAEGGDYQKRLAGIEWKDCFEVPKNTDPGQEQTQYAIDGTRNSGFEDTIGNKAEASEYPFVGQVIARIPEIRAFMTDAEVATRFRDFNVNGGVVEDTSTIILDLRRACNDLAREIARIRLGSYAAQGIYSKEAYETIIKEVWTSAYQKCSIARGTRLDDINNLSELRRLKHTLTDMNLKASWV